MRHTPGPWTVNQDATGDIFISGAKGEYVAEIGCPDESTAAHDAARIVACVNAHDELLTALTNLCKLMPKGDTLNYYYAKVEVLAARTVLAKWET